MIRAIAGASLIGFTACAAFGQAPAAAPAFEVASVKPNLSGRLGYDPSTLSHGNFTIRNVSLKTLLSMACRVQGTRITGGPGWFDSDRYDIVAKGEANATNQQVLLMLQTLLADRFKLAFHRETRELPIYALITGKNGPKLHKVDGDCAPAPSKSPLPPLPCGEIARLWGPKGGYLWGHGASMAAVAEGLSDAMERPVVDRTHRRI